MNGTDSSWPPVWYLERSAKKNEVSTQDVLEATPATESSFTSISSSISSTTAPNISESTMKIESAEPLEEIETTTNLVEPEKPRTRVSTAALARLCLFQNICSQEDAEEYFQRQERLRRIITTTTVRTTTKRPVRTRRPRTRNPLLVAQLRACMQDSKYCNTDTFNHQHQMAMKGLHDKESTSNNTETQR